MKKYLLAAAIVMLFSCEHKKEGWLVLGQDGNIYKLEQSPGNETYRLISIDSAALNHVMKMLRGQTVEPYWYDPTQGYPPMPYKGFIPSDTTNLIIHKYNK